MKIAFCFLVTLFTAALAVPFEKRQTFKDPNDDDFYVVPQNINSFSKGQVIRSRLVPTDIGTNNGATSYQLLYRTSNTQNEATATVATIFVPAKPAASPKIFSYQVYEDSTQLDCAPSFNYLSGPAGPNEATVALDTPIIVAWALQQGYYVVSADHEGYAAAFIAGYQESRAILDGIKALQNYKNLSPSTPVAMYGYSGGSHATVWAATLAASYAPKLNIIGAAHGGTPVSTKQIFTFLNGGPFAGFAIAGVSGLGLGYPKFEKYVQSQLNARGLTTLKQVRGRGFCLGQVVSSFPFVDAIRDLTNNPNLLNEPAVANVLKQETLLQSEASWTVPVPTFPRFIWHALEDEIVPFQPAAQYVAEQCAKGGNIFFSIFPVAEHITAEILGLAPGLLFIKQAFDGTNPKTVCGTAFPTLPSPQSSQTDQILGPQLAAQLRSLNGATDVYGQKIHV